MRLLNTQTFRLEEFIGQRKPPYAILSHTWGEDEVLFEDVQESSVQRWKTRPAGVKIVTAARLALFQGYTYIWIDTCCIDKRSSSELSEAINSMYRWYEESALCFAYLSDISGGSPDDLAKSRWFTRGWTLQELIAPKTVFFYDSDWLELGSRQDLLGAISAITGISSAILKRGSESYPARLGDFSISEKMLWAAGRETKKEEDMAYCLMGLFGVNMPLLYGEGKKAFRRLQQEILRQSSGDHTILLHKDRCDLFASSPASYDIGIRTFRDSPFVDPLNSIWLADDGISLDLFAFTIEPAQRARSQTRSVTLGVLDCGFGHNSGDLARPVIVLEVKDGEHYFARNSGVFMVKPSMGNMAVYVPNTRERMPHDLLSHTKTSDLCSIPLCCQVSIDPAKFQRRRITIRQMKPFPYRWLRPPYPSLRLNPISPSINGKGYEFGFCFPPQSDCMVDLGTELIRESNLRIRAVVSLMPASYTAIQDRYADSLIMILGSFDTWRGVPDIWHRIMPMTGFLEAEEFERLKQENDLGKILDEGDIFWKLQNLYETRHDVIPVDRNSLKSTERYLTTAGTDVVVANLEKARFFGRDLYDLKITIEAAEDSGSELDIGSVFSESF